MLSRGRAPVRPRPPADRWERPGSPSAREEEPGELALRHPVRLPVQTLHAAVEFGGGIRCIREAVDEVRGHLVRELVVDLVLEARPEVHRYRAELHLHRHRERTGRQEHGHLDDRVQALVAVGLGVGDVVLDRAHGHVVLRGEQVEQSVYVGDEAAGHAHTGDVGDLCANAVEVGLVDALAGDLLDDAVGRLQPTLHVLDGVVRVVVRELVAQDRDLRLDLAHPELVLAQEPLQLVAQHAGLVDRVLGDVNSRHTLDVTAS